MRIFKLFMASFFVFILSCIITFSWHTILGWRAAANFGTALLFWIICVALVFINLAAIKPMDLELPFKITVLSADFLYFIIEVVVVSVGIFIIPHYIYVLLQLVLLFLYSVITIPIMVMSRPKRGEE